MMTTGTVIMTAPAISVPQLVPYCPWEAGDTDGERPVVVAAQQDAGEHVFVPTGDEGEDRGSRKPGQGAGARFWRKPESGLAPSTMAASSMVGEMESK